MPASASPPVEPAAPPPGPPPASPDPTGSEAEVEAAGGSYSKRSAVGTVNWGTATLVGVFAGLLYGGSKEASASVSKDAEVMLKMGSTPDKREQYRLMRDAMEKRFIRVAKGSLVGGARLGMFTATFFGIQNLLIDTRGVHDIFNIAGAGSATAAAFGLILPGSMMWRARNVLVGSALGAGICFPLGWVQLKLTEKANLEIANSKPSSDLTEGKGNQSRVGAAIERLEGSLKK
ncbi:uncharacterized protein LOC120675594 isoform X2 [Panicum virgatum]|uniref:Complex I assembly factor TIMMDC1, mitochondrial n=1 Tax=Panicum virgatum TaxID=38727 RepID=A0A8T0RNN0_PANVG|nr:uncharacterized protein LOC120675594 isoform X1 [Panicum virgatum]XP_039812727.1 uncharacterized protein LOC120675594 isoform X2 [Panicum virgatum]KAG2587931.1 hypothetical protein PVAP13_5NG183900 [Panicum virgatum]